MNRASDPDLKYCAGEPAEASSIPPRYYVSEQLAEAEIARVFRRNWIGLGRADAVAAPGDYIALDLAGQNMILLRDRHGLLRALANTCRHRGARLVDGQGSCKGLRCPFHSWFYDLDGQLVAAPHMEAASGFDKADFGLVAYRVEERLGFVFACLDHDGPDLDAHLGNLAEVLAPWPMNRLVSVRRQELEVACNWKAFLEVFNEYYHLPFVHPDSIDSVYSKPDAADAVAGAFASQFGVTQGTGGLLESDQDQALPDMPGLTGRAGRGARYTWVFRT